MLNITELLAAEVANRLGSNYAVMFGGADSGHLTAAALIAQRALTSIANSDALYHNVEHSVYVTVVGMQILLGRQILAADVTRDDWLNVTVALLCHDIGYVRGICAIDGIERLATGIGNQSVRVAAGSSDAALMPLHVDRGKRYVSEQFATVQPLIDTAVVQACIERTRFPVPDDPWYQQTADYPGLVRGADLIGQLSDPRYLHKLAAVFYEFEEIGFNRTTGYRKPGDLLQAYPAFFEKNVAPFIADAERYLQQTKDGREILASLYRNLEAARQPDTVELARQA
ncbi:MAG: metal-dependent phosphohydrolase [Gammaproteobacteria bacterium]|nr:metal-dependent phosphohydrolase [Gammaproteobacteria bacterium]